MYKHAIAYGTGAAGLGLVGLVAGDFALQWHPVPEGVPGRTFLAYANSVLLLAAALLILTPTQTLKGAYGLALLNALYVVLLHVPRILAAPAGVLPWLGWAEILSLAAAGLMLALALEGRARPKFMSATQFVFGICPIVYGLSHFAYAEFTASMIPAWIPGRLFWAYATGGAHVLAGLAIMSGALAAALAHNSPGALAVMLTLARFAAVMLALMLSLFTLLVHVTGVLSDPASRLQWTMLFVATSLSGAAWIISAAVPAGGKHRRRLRAQL